MEATPKAAVDWWMWDPPHRATMLNPDYTHTGFGVAEGVAFRRDQVPTVYPPRGLRHGARHLPLSGQRTNSQTHAGAAVLRGRRGASSSPWADHSPASR